MIVLKRISKGFLIFALLYVLLVISIPFVSNFMNITMNVKMQLFSLELGKIVNNSQEMYGEFTTYGLLLFGLVGVLLNISYLYLFQRSVYRV